MKLNEEQLEAYKKYKKFLEDTDNKIVLKALNDVMEDIKKDEN